MNAGIFKPRPRATTASPALGSIWRGHLLKRGGPSARRRKSNVVHPICFPSQEPHVLPLSTPTAAAARLDGRTADARYLFSDSYLLTIQILHGLDLVNPCCSRALHHAFIPTATITVSSPHLDSDRLYSCAASQHARNHSLWRASESSLELALYPSSTAKVSRLQHDEDPNFAVKVCVSGTCKHRTSGTESTESELQYIGETKEVCFTLATGNYEVAQFFTVWCRLGSSCALGPFEAGRIKMRVKVEVSSGSASERADSTPEERHDQIQPVQQPPGRPSLLPFNFADALAAKRKQLRSTVTPEDAQDQQSDEAQRLRDSQEADKATSEQVLTEIAGDLALTRFSATQVEILNQIGEGVHSSVLLGRLTGAGSASIDSATLSVDVAVKEFRYQQSFPPPKVLDNFRREYQLLEMCVREGACYIVRYLGILLTPRPAILTEYFPSGSLAQCMQKHASWCKVPSGKKARIALQVAEALRWLHIHNIVHRDVKRHNILLDLTTADHPIAKICDVGSAVVWRSGDRHLTEEAGSSGYTAPEIFTGGGYTNKVDVWSFGIVLWELFQQQSITHKESKDGTTREARAENPFVGLANDVFVELARTGTRPPCDFEDPGCPLLIGDVVQACWRFEPDTRPSMDEVVTRLRSIVDSLSAHAEEL